jgi:hypothetical protein
VVVKAVIQIMEPVKMVVLVAVVEVQTGILKLALAQQVKETLVALGTTMVVLAVVGAQVLLVRLVLLTEKAVMVGLELHLIQLGLLQHLLALQEIMLVAVEEAVGVVLLILQVAQEEQAVAVQVLLVLAYLLTEQMEPLIQVVEAVV